MKFSQKMIGEILGYENPIKSIAHIHEQHKERLDRFSFEQNGIVSYNLIGLFEICHYSYQPNAEAVIDFTLQVLEAKGNIETNNNSIFQFLYESLIEAKGFELKLADVYHKYRVWCIGKCYSPKSAIVFHRCIKGKYTIEKRRSWNKAKGANTTKFINDVTWL